MALRAQVAGAQIEGHAVQKGRILGPTEPEIAVGVGLVAGEAVDHGGVGAAGHGLPIDLLDESVAAVAFRAAGAGRLEQAKTAGMDRVLPLAFRGDEERVLVAMAIEAALGHADLLHASDLAVAGGQGHDEQHQQHRYCDFRKTRHLTLLVSCRLTAYFVCRS